MAPAGQAARAAPAARVGPGAARALAGWAAEQVVARGAAELGAQRARWVRVARRAAEDLPAAPPGLAARDPVAPPGAVVEREVARAARRRVAELAAAARRPKLAVVRLLGAAWAAWVARWPAAEVPQRRAAAVAARRPQGRVAPRAAAAERARPASPAALARSALAAVRRLGGCWSSLPRPWCFRLDVGEPPGANPLAPRNLCRSTSCPGGPALVRRRYAGQPGASQRSPS